ncbi:hypothetical protein ACWDUX_03140 [Streptomyces sp. NPDC003444]
MRRRGDNPHTEPNGHRGWGPTAHHVIARSTPAKALESLSTGERKEVLIAAVPSEITEEMLRNLRVTVPAGEDGKAFRKRLQDVDRLAEDTKLNRAHISGYTFFRFAEGDIKAGKHRYLASDGRTYTFHDVPVTGAQERGGYVYVPYLGAKDVAAPQGKGGAETLFASCERNGIPTPTFLPKGVYSPNNRR